MLDTCSDTCGWIAGVIGAFSFGSFGVPIKLVSNVKVDPLVMQSYKSTVCFLTCWLVIPLGETVKFTPWGIVSGLFWVPGATAGIYGIRNAGLAISVGTWSSLCVVSSFCWGIFVFDEKVKSINGACGAALVLITGLVGMSAFSAPVKIKEDKGGEEDVVPLLKDSKELKLLALAASNSEDEIDVGAVEAGDIQMTNAQQKKDDEPSTRMQNRNETQPKYQRDNGSSKPGRIITRRKKVESPSKIKKKKASRGEDGTSPSKVLNTGNEKLDEDKEDEFIFFGGKVRLSRRQLGIIGAVINGVWGGNNMIPLHYASKQGFHGAGYLISYSTGSMLVTIVMWLLRYLYNLYCWDFDRIQAYNALPSIHFRELWLAGLLSGGLYSLGNLCTILAVTSLGQGVGYSFVQTSMLVSGVWGIFFFGEVQGFNRILKWLLSSVITIAGILWLSYEHQGAVSHRRLLAIGM